MFVEVYSTKTRRKLPKPVPEHWLDHPILGRNLTTLPSRRAGQDEPSDDTDQVLVDGRGQDTSTEVPELITITETPAAGEDKE